MVGGKLKTKKMSNSWMSLAFLVDNWESIDLGKLCGAYVFLTILLMNLPANGFGLLVFNNVLHQQHSQQIQRSCINLKQDNTFQNINEA